MLYYNYIYIYILLKWCQVPAGSLQIMSLSMSSVFTGFRFRVDFTSRIYFLRSVLISLSTVKTLRVKQHLIPSCNSWPEREKTPGQRWQNEYMMTSRMICDDTYLHINWIQVKVWVRSVCLEVDPAPSGNTTSGETGCPFLLLSQAFCWKLGLVCHSSVCPVIAHPELLFQHVASLDRWDVKRGH